MTYIPGFTEEKKDKQEITKSKTFEEFFKKNNQELEKIRNEINENLSKKGYKKGISKAGIEDIAYLLWLYDELKTDEEVLSALKKVLKRLLDWGSIISLFKKD